MLWLVVYYSTNRPLSMYIYLMRVQRMLVMVSVAVAMGYNVNKQELRPEECTAQPGGKTTPNHTVARH